MSRLISVEELSKNNSKSSLWVAINRNVYDLTKFKKHPGGQEILLRYAGKDATKKFNSIHSEDARAMMKDFLIGKLKGTDVLGWRVLNMYDSSVLVVYRLESVFIGDIVVKLRCYWDDDFDNLNVDEFLWRVVL